MDEHIDASHPKDEAQDDTLQAVQPVIYPPPARPSEPPKTNGEPEKISKSDKIMIVATIVIAAGTLVSAAAIGMQWREMHNGSSDTTAIAIASGRSATAAENFTIAAQGINAHLDTAVGKLNDQAVAMGKVADQALIQAKAARVSADAAKSASDTAKDALIEVQRPVMAISTLDVTRGGGTNGQIEKLLIFVRWRNVGSTPTKNLIIRYSYLYTAQKLPESYPYPDLGGPETNTPSFAAPQGEISSLPIEIPVSVAKDIQDGKLVMTIWGHANYRDVFKGTPAHTSQYCSIITGFYGNLYSLDSTQTTVATTENCKAHNCRDEECKAN